MITRRKWKTQILGTNVALYDYIIYYNRSKIILTINTRRFKFACNFCYLREINSDQFNLLIYAFIEKKKKENKYLHLIENYICNIILILKILLSSKCLKCQNIFLATIVNKIFNRANI